MERRFGENPSGKSRNPNRLKRNAVVHARHIRTGIDSRNHYRSAKSVQRIDSIMCMVSQGLLAFRVAENSRAWREFSFASRLAACYDRRAPPRARNPHDSQEWASCLLASCGFGVLGGAPILHRKEAHAGTASTPSVSASRPATVLPTHRRVFDQPAKIFLWGRKERENHCTDFGDFPSGHPHPGLRWRRDGGTERFRSKNAARRSHCRGPG